MMKVMPRRLSTREIIVRNKQLEKENAALRVSLQLQSVVSKQKANKEADKRDEQSTVRKRDTLNRKSDRVSTLPTQGRPVKADAVALSTTRFSKPTEASFHKSLGADVVQRIIAKQRAKSFAVRASADSRFAKPTVSFSKKTLETHQQQKNEDRRRSEALSRQSTDLKLIRRLSFRKSADAAALDENNGEMRKRKATNETAQHSSRHFRTSSAAWEQKAQELIKERRNSILDAEAVDYSDKPGIVVTDWRKGSPTPIQRQRLAKHCTRKIKHNYDDEHKSVWETSWNKNMRTEMLRYYTTNEPCTHRMSAYY